MVRLLADENLNGNIVRGVLRRMREADLVRVQDVGLSGSDDPTMLEWAAEHDRILITHDVSTVAPYAYERVAAGLPMPGVFELPRSVSIRQAIDDLLLILGVQPAGGLARAGELPASLVDDANTRRTARKSVAARRAATYLICPSSSYSLRHD